MEFTVAVSGNGVTIEQGKFRAQASLAWGNRLKNPINNNGKPIMPKRIAEIEYDDVKSVYEVRIEYENGAMQMFGGADLRVLPGMEGILVLSDEDGLIKYKI
jgi:hypothetical protein